MRYTRVKYIYFVKIVTAKNVYSYNIMIKLRSSRISGALLRNLQSSPVVSRVQQHFGRIYLIQL